MSATHAVVAGLAIALFSRPIRADDGPVERPSVARPAAATPAPEQPVAEPQAHSRAPAKPARAAQRAPEREERASATAHGRGYPFFAIGAGVLAGLSGGAAFERTRPALSAGFGAELPLAQRTSVGFELVGDLELPQGRDVSRYHALLVRARIGYWLSPSTRLWGAAGVGLAGYESSQFAPTLAFGSTFLFAPRLGMDVSASLAFPGAAHPPDDVPFTPYDGGSVLLLAARFVYEARR